MLGYEMIRLFKKKTDLVDSGPNKLEDIKILHAMVNCDYNVEHIATVLGISVARVNYEVRQMDKL